MQQEFNFQFVRANKFYCQIFEVSTLNDLLLFLLFFLKMREITNVIVKSVVSIFNYFQTFPIIS